jgi:RNA polymerase sigma-70 factor (ECF subfamily)
MNSSFADSSETARLLEQVSRGDRHAFGPLFQRHQDELRRVIELRLDRRLRSRLDPSDVVQETQLEAYRRIDDYLHRRPMPFGLWLRKTAQERLLKLREQHLLAARRSVERELLPPEQTSLDLVRRMMAKGPTPSQSAMAKEHAARVREALGRLAEPDREILMMRHLEKLTNADIACILSMTPAAVSKRHARALLKLEKLLRELDLREDNA